MSCIRTALCATALALAGHATTVSAQSYATGQIRLISPYPPGGGTDVLGRAIAQKLNEAWGQPVVVENRVGANGTIGAAFVAKAPADGRTILLVPAGYAANPALYSSLPYDQSRDLMPVSHLASGPLVLVTHPALPARDLKAFIALAKAKPNSINYGTPGAGALPHLSAELFSMMAGVKMVHVPYKGPSAAIIDLMSGEIQAYFINILQSLALVKAGKLRALGLTSPQRSPIAPNLPAIGEAALPGFDMTNWYGMLVPAGTPSDSLMRLQREVNRILNLAELKERLANDGMTVVANTPEQFTAFLAKETEKYNNIVKTAGIRSQ
jgi:tripartite-type tricarboxylate transporter receptor subunit TctC